MELPAKKLRQWNRVVVIPALIGGIAGFLVSSLIHPKYTSRSLVSEVRSENLDAWGPVILEDYEARLATIQREILASDRLLPMIERISVVKPGQEKRLVEEIRRNIRVEPALSGASKSELTANNKHGVPESEVLGFYVVYTDSSSRRAQQVCDGLVSVLMEEIWKQRIKSNDDTQRFLQSQVEYAKSNLKTMHDQFVKRGLDPRRDSQYKRAEKSYIELLTTLQQAKEGAQAESALGGELGIRRSPANLPNRRDFANRGLCAGVGFSAGLLVGIGLLLV